MIGWVAFLFTLIGMWRLGSKDYRGFFWAALGSVLWIVHAWGDAPIVAVNVTLCSAHVVGLYRWTRNK